MNIIYVSDLYDKAWTGPRYSVPNQIKYQAKYDKIFWINMNSELKGVYAGDIKCWSIDEMNSLSINNFPEPFNKPDLVVFEELYCINFIKFAKQCLRSNIPYIVIPRCALTKQAQKKSRIKKILGNILFFNKFIKNAIAIQYLTRQEYEDSGEKWNKEKIIIPNGIEKQNKTKENSELDSIKGVFIGRPDIYHKGIDLLLEACSNIKNELQENNVKLDIYSPNISNYKEKIQSIINNYGIQELVTQRDGVFGEDKENVLLNSDFFILTSRFEGHPMGLIEALSYGLPCLVTTGSNMGEEIKTYNAGWVAQTEVISIQQKLLNLIAERETWNEKGRNAIKLSNEYSWETIAKNSNYKYRKLIHNSKEK